MDENIRTDILLKTAKLYFEEGLSQAEIGKIIGFSRPYVSKLIMEAQNKGIVTIKVHETLDTETSLEKKIRTKFNLIRVFAIHSKLDENSQYKIANHAANYIPSLLQNGDIIAVDNGNTLYRCAKCMESQVDLENITVVQSGGCFTNLSYPTYGESIPFLMAQALNVIGYFYPVPAIAASPQVKNCLLEEPYIRHVRELQNQASVSLFTVDSLSMGSSSNVVNSGYLSEEELDTLVENGVVGSVFDHFIKNDGSIYSAELDEKVLSLSLDELLKKKYRICLAQGRAKYKAVFAALRKGYINILIVDEDTAKAISIMANDL